MNRGGTLCDTWQYEAMPLAEAKTAKLLVKIVVGKVKKARKDFEKSIEKVPIIQNVRL